MLQGVSVQLPSSGDQPPPPQPHGGGGGAELGGGGSLSGGFSEEEKGIRIEEGDRSSGGGNRWPRQETLALLKIRSDMDVAFRDSSLKGPLWDEVSRKLAELGFHRSAKKCKEKFENVYKYHKRTKEGRTSKADGKTYRFFDQLEALEANPGGGGGGHPPPPAAPKPPPASALVAPSNSQPVTVPSVVITPFSITASHQNNVSPISVAAPAVPMPTMNHHVGGFPFPHPNISGSTDSSSSSTSSDEEPPERRRKRKRKWKDFFGRLMKEVIDKQEELQMKFLERIERRERERMAREEAWRMEEMAKMNREHDLLVQERSMAAAKDAAVITFLQKITEQNPNAVPQMPAIPFLQPPQQQPQQQQQNQKPPPPPQPQPMQQQQQPQQSLPPPSPQHQIQQSASIVPNSVSVSISVPVHLSSSALPPAPVVKNPENTGGDSGGGGGGGSGGENMLAPSPSRWPKAEINALIKLRTTLDTKYQENAPKGPLWEEISAAMRKLGYNRNAKRCKEKWENINKYYKKVKESSKKRPEDSKTCPYFHQLDAIYREKANNNPVFALKHEATQMAPIMAQPEQQWPLPAAAPPQQQQQQQRSTTNESTGVEDHGSENNEDDYDEDDDNYENEGGQYEIVPNKTSSMAAVE